MYNLFFVVRTAQNNVPYTVRVSRLSKKSVISWGRGRDTVENQTVKNDCPKPTPLSAKGYADFCEQNRGIFPAFFGLLMRRGSVHEISCFLGRRFDRL